MCMHLCLFVCTCVWMPAEVRRWCWVLWSWSYRWVELTWCGCWKPNKAAVLLTLSHLSSPGSRSLSEDCFHWKKAQTLDFYAALWYYKFYGSGIVGFNKLLSRMHYVFSCTQCLFYFDLFDMQTSNNLHSRHDEVFLLYFFMIYSYYCYYDVFLHPGCSSPPSCPPSPSLFVFRKGQAPMDRTKFGISSCSKTRHLSLY